MIVGCHLSLIPKLAGNDRWMSLVADSKVGRLALAGPWELPTGGDQSLPHPYDDQEFCGEYPIEVNS